MKTIQKRVLPILLCLTMLMGMLSLNAGAAQAKSGKCGKKVKWSFNEGKSTLTISGKGEMADYVGDIDAETTNAPWAGLNFTKVVVKKGVTSIGNYAFYRQKVKTVCLPKGLKRIGKFAFTWTPLKKLTLPKSLKKIGMGAFTETKLASVSVKKGSKYFSVKKGVLFNKKKTKLVYYPILRKGSTYKVPGSVKTIGEYAFGCGHREQGSKGNPYLKKLVFGKKLEKLETLAFVNCRAEKLCFYGKPPVFGKYALINTECRIYAEEQYAKQWEKAVKQLQEEYNQ